MKPPGRGDEQTLARIQTESWRAAFSAILPPEALAQATQTAQVEAMYRRVLGSAAVRLLIEWVDDQPHAIAGWGPSRDVWGKKRPS